MDRSQLAYWESRARDWSIAPPLSPSAEDVAWYEAKAHACANAISSRGMRALLLGATSATATMRWPQDTVLTVVDWADGMIRLVWPIAGLPKASSAVRADWRELPLASASIDFAVADGCSGVLPSADDITLYFREVHRVLRKGGIYCERCFCRPGHSGSVAVLFEDLFAGRLRDLDLFRLLLAMTVQGNSPEGVSLQAVWRIWNERVPNPERLRERYGWTARAMRNFGAWRESDGRYCYRSQAEIIALAEPFFSVVARDSPSYAEREYFPRLLMRAREAAVDGAC